MKNRLLLFLFSPFILASALTTLTASCNLSRDGGIFRSLDQGGTWQQKVAIDKSHTIATSNILTLSIDPHNSQIIYAGTRGEGIYKSMDGGEIWYHLSDVNKALDDRANVYDVAIDPQNSANIYIGVYQNRLGRFLRSSDAGKSWEEVYRVSREQYAVFAVEIDPYNPAIIYMGTAEDGLLKSVDYGKDWETINWFNDVVTDIKVNPYDTNTVFVSTYTKGIYWTNDQGVTWQSLDGLKNFPRETDEMQILVMDQRNPNVLYSGSKHGLLKSGNAGQSWQRVNIVIPPESVPIQAIALDPLTSAYLYYAAGNVIYRTQDNGQTWSVHPLASTRNVNALAIDPKNPQIIYAGLHD